MEKGNRLYHFLDRYAGIPAVFFLGLFRKRGRKPPTRLNRIAIVNLFSIGDNVLMSGVIADLVAAYPNAELVAFVANNNFHLVKLIPGFTQVIKLPIASPLKSIAAIKSAGAFDLVIDFGAWPRVSAIYTFFVKGKYKTGFKSGGQHRHYTFDRVVNYSHSIHEIENYRNLVSDFYKGEYHLPKINFVTSEASEDFIKQAGNYCIVHPWPGGFKSHLKQWDNLRWIDLIYRIAPNFDSIVLTGAPGDIEKCAAFENLLDKKQLHSTTFINIAGQFSLGETAHLLKEAAFVISIDTGIAHMSAAFSKPMIGIQGPASSVRWRPYHPSAAVVNPNKGTYGYLSFGYEYYRAKENCMENISVDAVYTTFLNMYKQPVLNKP